MAQEENQEPERATTDNGELDAARVGREVTGDPARGGVGADGGLSAAEIEGSETDGAGTGGVGDDAGGSGAVRPEF